LCFFISEKSHNKRPVILCEGDFPSFEYHSLCFLVLDERNWGGDEEKKKMRGKRKEKKNKEKEKEKKGRKQNKKKEEEEEKEKKKQKVE
jgi:hypothetical protein